MILLDTDTISLFHAGDPRVTTRVHQVLPPETVGTTVITRAEILQARFEFLLKASHGEQWQRAQYWLSESKSFLADRPVENVDERAAEQIRPVAAVEVVAQDRSSRFADRQYRVVSPSDVGNPKPASLSIDPRSSR
jgi:predicted nucleic acid-binding protein